MFPFILKLHCRDVSLLIPLITPAERHHLFCGTKHGCLNCHGTYHSFAFNHSRMQADASILY